MFLKYNFTMVRLISYNLISIMTSIKVEKIEKLSPMIFKIST